MSPIKKIRLLERLSKAEKFYTKKDYSNILKSSRKAFENGQFAVCEKELDKLPSSAILLERLRDKLKDKHLCRTLRKIEEGKAGNSVLVAKGLSSLLTHIIIECEHGNTEYRILLPNVVEKLNEVIYGLYGQGE